MTWMLWMTPSLTLCLAEKESINQWILRTRGSRTSCQFSTRIFVFVGIPRNRSSRLELENRDTHYPAAEYLPSAPTALQWNTSRCEKLGWQRHRSWRIFHCETESFLVFLTSISGHLHARGRKKCDSGEFHSPSDHLAMERNILEEYTQSNGMFMNSRKSNYLIFCLKKVITRREIKSHRHDCPNWNSCSCEAILNVTETKYLGMVIDGSAFLSS